MPSRLVRRSGGSFAAVTVWDGRPAPEAIDAIYQTEGCGEHTFFVATKRPIGRWIKVADQLSLAGTASNAECAANLEDFIFGDERWLQFEVDPINTHDTRAIKVFGIWSDQTDHRPRRRWIGWVSKNDNIALHANAKRNGLIGTPKTFFYGKGAPGLRFNVYLDEQIELNECAEVLNLLLRLDGASPKDILNISSLVTRSRLDKLSKGEIVTSVVMEAFSGFRVEKKKQGARIRYIAVHDPSRIYQRTSGWDPNANDPMGADVPLYVRDWHENLDALTTNSDVPLLRTDQGIRDQPESRLAPDTAEVIDADRSALLHDKQSKPSQSTSGFGEKSSLSWWRRVFG